MFDKNEFNAMLARKGMTRDDLAKILCIRRETLYKKIKNDGSFNAADIKVMLQHFDSKELFRALFSCE